MVMGEGVGVEGAEVRAGERQQGVARFCAKHVKTPLLSTLYLTLFP